MFNHIFDSWLTNVSGGGDFRAELVWHSDIDGYLGTGRKALANLSLGRHRIVSAFQRNCETQMDEESVYIREKFCADETPSVADATNQFYPLNFINNESVPVTINWLRTVL